MTAKRRRFQGKSHIDFTKDGRVIPYQEMFDKLPPRERPIIDAKAIFGVLQLSLEKIHKGRVCRAAPLGTTVFLEGRLKRLIRDKKHDGFTKAAQRFRVAVKRWREERPGFYLCPDDLVMKKIPAPSTGFVHPRSYLKHATAIPRALIEATWPERAYEPEDGEDLLAIPSFLDRKSEVPLDHPLRRCRKAKVEAA